MNPHGLRRFASAWLLVIPAGCSPAASPPPPSLPPASPSPAALDASPDQPTASLPPAWSHRELDALRRTILEKTEVAELPAQPRPGDPPPVLHELVEGREVLSMTEFDPRRNFAGIPRGEHGELVDVHSLPFRRAPWASIADDGTILLRWETLRSHPATSVYFGTTLPEEEAPEPRYRKHVTAKSSDDGFTHSATYPVARLIAPKYDVAQGRSTGRGVVEYRLEIVDTRYATTRLHDDRVAFRCEPVPCGDDARYVQLPTVSLGPFVDQPTTRSAIVSWTTDVPTAGFVVVRGATGEERIHRSSAAGTRHEVSVEGLEPDRRYRYHVFAVDRRGEVGDAGPGTIRTAPEGERPFRFAVLSDSRSGNDVGEASYGGMNRQVLLDLLTLAHGRDARFVVFAGDLIDGYTTSPAAYRMELRSWIRTSEPVGRHLPIFEGIGNHEALIEAWSPGWAVDRRRGPNTESVFAELFVNPRNGPSPADPAAPPYLENVFSFDYGNAHFAVVNANYRYRSHIDRDDHPGGSEGYREGTVTDEQIAWLDADLEAARKRGAAHLFVFTHEPAFPNGGHVQDGMYWSGKVPDMLERRKRFWSTLVEHRVLAAFFGDEHNYSRTLIDGSLDAAFVLPIWSVISGGAGAPYYAQDGSVPWAPSVRAFSARQHFVLVEIHGASVRLEAVDRRGRTFDEADLDGRR